MDDEAEAAHRRSPDRPLRCLGVLVLVLAICAPAAGCVADPAHGPPIATAAASIAPSPALGARSTDAPPGVPRGAELDRLGGSLADLVAHAPTIVVADAQAVQSADLGTQWVSLLVVEVLKGSVRPGDPITVAQLMNDNSYMHPGDRFVLFAYPVVDRERRDIFGTPGPFQGQFWVQPDSGVMHAHGDHVRFPVLGEIHARPLREVVARIRGLVMTP